jgi:hypothetical protein
MGPPPSLPTGGEFLHDIVEWYMDNLPFLRNFNYKIIIKNFHNCCPFKAPFEAPPTLVPADAPRRENFGPKEFKSSKSWRISRRAPQVGWFPTAWRGLVLSLKSPIRHFPAGGTQTDWVVRHCSIKACRNRRRSRLYKDISPRVWRYPQIPTGFGGHPGNEGSYLIASRPGTP